MITVRPNRHEVIERGEALYSREIRARIEPDHLGQFVALDVESGEYEVDADKRAALDRLMERQPEAVPYLLRVGRPTAVTLGAAVRAVNP